MGRHFYKLNRIFLVKIKLRTHLCNLNGFKMSKLINIREVKRVSIYRSYFKMPQVGCV